MEWVGELFDWIAANEAMLSGLVAVIAIGAIILAFGNKSVNRLRSLGNPVPVARSKAKQEIRYCTTGDGQRVAWSSVGKGTPLVRSLGWFTNLEMEWNSPASAPFWNQLADKFQLIRYDGRGMGVSDRKVVNFSPETRLEDLEAVVAASGVEKFALMGLSEGGTTAIKYAAKYPERVTHLVIWGSFLVPPDPEDIPEMIAIARLVPTQWGGKSAAFHQMFTAMFLPEGNASQNRHFNAMQRESATPETAAAFLRSIGKIDVKEVAASVTVPTLILHRKGDLVSPLKYGQEMAAVLPNARLVMLEGSNHWMVCEDDDMHHIIELIEDFVGEISA